MQRLVVLLGCAGLLAFGVGVALLAGWPLAIGTASTLAAVVAFPPLLHMLDDANLAPTIWGMARSASRVRRGSVRRS